MSLDCSPVLRGSVTAWLVALGGETAGGLGLQRGSPTVMYSDIVMLLCGLDVKRVEFPLSRLVESWSLMGMAPD